MMSLEGNKVRCMALFCETDSGCSSSNYTDEENAEYKTRTGKLHMQALK